MGGYYEKGGTHKITRKKPIKKLNAEENCCCKHNDIPPPPLSFYAKFGGRGDGDGQFEYPHGIAIDSNYIYVTDSDNHRVQIFEQKIYSEKNQKEDKMNTEKIISKNEEIESLRKCDNCGCEITKKDNARYIEADNKTYCTDCYIKNVYRCVNCGYKSVDKKHFLVVNGWRYCDNCASICEICGENLPKDKLTIINEHKYCVDCVDYCNACSKKVVKNNCVEINGKFYCDFCLDIAEKLQARMLLTINQ